MAEYLTDQRQAHARDAVPKALAFLDESDYPTGAAWVQHRWQGGSSAHVLDALKPYQQPDGGFAGLEVDIRAPVSNPFATRLAMQVTLSLRERPKSPIFDRTASWLEENQHADGDWHFVPEIREHPLSPWFEGWTFPSLNPACSLAGLAHALEIATPEMLKRVAALWEEHASLDDAESGDFYPMLPLVEYVAHIEVDSRNVWLDSLAKGIGRGIAANSFGDAEHALEHIVGGGPDLVARLDADDLVKVIDNVLADQQPDGGWPTPYDPAWRPWTTANMLVLLSRLDEFVG